MRIDEGGCVRTEGYIREDEEVVASFTNRGGMNWEKIKRIL